MTPEEILRVFGAVFASTTASEGPSYASPPRERRTDGRVPIGRGVHGEPIYEADVIRVTTEKEST